MAKSNKTKSGKATPVMKRDAAGKFVKVFGEKTLVRGVVIPKDVPKSGSRTIAADRKASGFSFVERISTNMSAQPAAEPKLARPVAKADPKAFIEELLVEDHIIMEYLAK